MKTKSPNAMTHKEALQHEAYLKEQLQKTQARLIELKREDSFVASGIDWENLLRFGGANHSTIYAEQQAVLNVLSPVGFTGSYNTTNRQWILRVSMDSNYQLAPMVLALMRSALPYMKEVEDNIQGKMKSFCIDFSEDGNGKLQATLDVMENGTCRISTYFHHELDNTETFESLEDAIYEIPVNTIRDSFYRSKEYQQLVDKYLTPAPMSAPTQKQAAYA